MTPEEIEKQNDEKATKLADATTIWAIALVLICFAFCIFLQVMPEPSPVPVIRSENFTVRRHPQYPAGGTVHIDGIDEDFDVTYIDIGDASYVDYEYNEKYDIYIIKDVVLSPEKAEGFLTVTVEDGT